MARSDASSPARSRPAARSSASAQPTDSDAVASLVRQTMRTMRRPELYNSDRSNGTMPLVFTAPHINADVVLATFRGIGYITISERGSNAIIWQFRNEEPWNPKGYWEIAHKSDRGDRDVDAVARALAQAMWAAGYMRSFDIREIVNANAPIAKHLVHLYDSLAGYDNAAVRKQASRWLQAQGLTAREANVSARAIKLVTPQEFKSAFETAVRKFSAAAVQYFRQHSSAPRIICILVERGGRKSSGWLAAVGARLIRRLVPGVSLVACYAGTYDVGTVYVGGCRLFVHFDDAMYSGQQKSELVDAFQRTMRNPLSVPDWGRAHLFIIVAASTGVGRQLVNRTVELHRVTPSRRVAVTILVGRRIPAMDAEIRIRGAMRGLTAGATLAIMPHKVPNSVSFGFQRIDKGGLTKTLANNMENRFGKAVYKRSVSNSDARGGKRRRVGARRPRR